MQYNDLRMDFSFFFNQCNFLLAYIASNIVLDIAVNSSILCYKHFFLKIANRNSFVFRDCLSFEQP